jgi:3-oxoadipate enol-lactonase
VSAQRKKLLDKPLRANNMPYQTINERRYYYEKEGKGPPVVLIGGYTSDTTLWTPVRARLAGKFEILLFDNYAIGRSDCGDSGLSLEEMAEDTLLLAERVGFHQPHIIGHSMGGAIAQILAWRHPERLGKVVLAQTFLKVPPSSGLMMQTVLRLFEEGLSARRRAEIILPWLFADNFLTNPQRVETFLASFEKNANPPSLKGLQHQLKALLQFDSTDWYHRITKPALILAGSEDRMNPHEDSVKLSDKIPGALLHVFHDVGHVAPAEDPEEFCRVIANYLGTYYAALPSAIA